MSMPNIAAQTLQRQIQCGRDQTGQMLPAQRILAVSMGLSRTSLREALPMLETLGFIRTVAGKGTLVTAGRPSLDTGEVGTPRDAVLAQLQAKIVDEAPFVWVAHDIGPRAMSAKVKGVVQPQSWFIDIAAMSLD